MVEIGNSAVARKRTTDGDDVLLKRALDALAHGNFGSMRYRVEYDNGATAINVFMPVMDSTGMFDFLYVMRSSDGMITNNKVITIDSDKLRSLLTMLPVGRGRITISDFVLRDGTLIRSLDDPLP